jgi:hypothetical protein
MAKGAILPEQCRTLLDKACRIILAPGATVLFAVGWTLGVVASRLRGGERT